MKWFYLTLAVGLALTACTEQENPNPALEKKNVESSIRSISEAHAIATKVIGAERVNSRSGIRLKSPEETHIITNETSRSGLSDTLLYVIDVEDDGGFVILAAPKDVEPIMAIIDKGSYDNVDNLGNEAFQTTCDLIKNYVSYRSIPNSPDT